MEEQDKIPTSKVQRAGKFFKTSLKVGGNYIKHAAGKVVGSDETSEDLHRKNAEEVFNLLNTLKGSALKVAQMMSMDTGLLPKEYADKFAEAQNKAMSLSGPLVNHTFIKYTGKNPTEFYDQFDNKAIFAASIGQVHVAYKNNEKLAVKIQYPGVAEAIHSDIQMVKPLAARLIGVPTNFLDYYAEEFEQRLTEECNYNLELKSGVETAEACKELEGLIIPKYYPELTTDKILTMEWMDGMPLKQFIDEEKNQEIRNKIGQYFIDFIFYQIHFLKRFNADPHPGNFLVSPDLKLIALDFGCMKTIPEKFYKTYFSIASPEIRNDDERLNQILMELDVIRPEDSEEDKAFFKNFISTVIDIFLEPLQSDSFYFGDKEFAKKLNRFGNDIAGNKEFRKPKAMRGNRDAIFLHRTFFGMYSILFQLDATVKVDKRFIEWVKA